MFCVDMERLMLGLKLPRGGMAGRTGGLEAEPTLVWPTTASCVAVPSSKGGDSMGEDISAPPEPL